MNELKPIASKALPARPIASGVRIGHVHLKVSDLDRALDFYCGVLGFSLMQRYGVLRIYGRKAGDDHGRLEKPMLIVWLVTGLAFIGAYVNLKELVLKLKLAKVLLLIITVV